MTDCTTNILIKAISLTNAEFANIKNQIGKYDWGVLLESADREHIDSRWSIYSAQPIASLQTDNGKTTLMENGAHSLQSGDPFALLEGLRRRLFYDTPSDDHFPFTGGALGYMAYELGYQVEQISNA